jgi:hypothetical protein
MLSKESVLTKSEENVLSSTVEEEVVLLNLKQGAYYTLDLIGAEIWRMLDKPTTAGAIIALILEEYDAPREQVEADVFALLNDLHDEGLIQVDGKPAAVKRESDAATGKASASKKPQTLQRGKSEKDDRAPTVKRGNLLSKFVKSLRGQ